MKKNWFIACMMLCTLMIATSCSDDDEETVSKEWKEANRQAFYDISADKNYTELKSLNNRGSIYYKVLKTGEGTEPIYYNSKVAIYYTGYMLNPSDYSKWLIFDKNEYPEQDPYTSLASGFVAGFTTALQYMKEGDRWEIWIPYQLAYDASGYNAIPGYTTLKFELEVQSILEP
ncbi:FKBP-type peptidyl-prolyl cis-trans isomerase [Parabacteroides sp. OttesenSCG-928-J18]|nr:FKBP-type peptidyl-prolyl cis-trans isomerase [Parabacteroides sp. OttesenSCG-928-J18]